MAKLFLIILFVLTVLGVCIACEVSYLIGNAKGFSDGYKAGQKGGME